jgi:hypothetical protein
VGWKRAEAGPARSRKSRTDGVAGLLWEMRRLSPGKRRDLGPSSSPARGSRREMPIPSRYGFQPVGGEVMSMVVLAGMVIRLGFRGGQHGLVALDVTVLLVADVDPPLEPEVELATEPRRN